MKQLDKVTAVLDAKKIRYEITEGEYGRRIGISKRDAIWDWYDEISDDYLSFCQTYSQITGKAKRGVTQSLKKMREYYKILNFYI